MLALRKAVPRFDGRVSYDVFRRTFDDLVGAYPGLTRSQRFSLLVSALEKEPMSLLEDLGPHGDFDTLDEMLRMAYSRPLHAPSEMRSFFSLAQGEKEGLEEWSTRVCRAARRAYPDTAPVRVEGYAIEQFIRGLYADDIRSGVSGGAFQTMHATPPSLQGLDQEHPAGHARDVDQALRVLPYGLVVPSELLKLRRCGIALGTVPFSPGLVELEIQNESSDHVIIPRGSVVAHIYPTTMDDLLDCVPDDQEVLVQSASLELVPPSDQADIQLQPRLPPIPADQPLPDDLQAMVDRSWPEAIPLRTIQAPEVAQALVTQVFSRLGAPYSIVSDQGTTFESHLFKEVLAIYKVHKGRISGGKPSSNGKVENYIRSLARQIAVLAGEQPENWPDLIPHVLHAYRAAVSTVTGFSPYEILFGRQMRVPQDVVHGIPPTGFPGADGLQRYPAQLRERLDKIHRLVQSNTHSAAIRMKTHYDKYSTLTYFKPGDMVLLYNRRRRLGKTTKLYAAWEGPFVILDLLNDCIARIEEVRPVVVSPNRSRLRPPKRLIVHVDRLAAVGSQLVDQNGQWLSFHSN
ncbi:hypothetical protein ONE63_006351 [Megalurothrips usitatus]|uniref:Integrase catalytic domain-containing protein n=1 Tax=Megalurothrips usitatus TaxID=439358 RepID=A0AAV7XX40_9NEOP|nr:hypothetical protein ONE63_006351 [Megalurothrips usitatus]